MAGKEYKEEAKIGDFFGDSWATHWFRLEIEVPEAWVTEEVHFLWNGKCEGSLYTLDGSRLL
jgi:alpha-mannosidase